MSLWNKTSKFPSWLTRAEKRSVIVTDVGFVRRQIKTDVHSNVRIMDQIYVPIRDLADSSDFGFARVADVWHVPTNATINSVVNTYITFTEPVNFIGTSGPLKLAIANTAGGNNMIATASSVSGANNTVVFRWKPSTAGTYKVQAQTMANGTATAVTFKSANIGHESANLVITGTESNTAGLVTVTV